MYLLTKTKFKNFIISLLTFMLVITLAFATACGKTQDDDDKKEDDNSTTTEETTITDYQVITNGDFEFSTKDTTDYPYASSISWSRSTDSDNNTAPSSKYSSGIIDTATTAFDKLDKEEVPAKDGAKLNPGTPYSEGKITQQEAEGYYDYEDEDKRVNAQVKGTKILMIHNKTSEEGLGTAQKFKSNSTVSIPVNSYAILSIWVKTCELKAKGDGVPGAYVMLTDKYASNSYKNYEIRNIDTNGEWQKFEICVQGSELVTTSFSITIGLGRGNGTFKKDFVEGFAFFDNIQATVYTQKEFNALNKTVDFNSNVKEEAKLITKEYAGANSVYPLSFKYTKKDVEKITINDGTFGYSDNVDTSYDLTGAGVNAIGKKSIDALDATNEKQIKDATNDFSDLGILDKNVIYFDFEKESTGYYETSALEIAKNGYHYITFFAKTFVNNDAVKMAKVDIVNTTKETPSWLKDDVKVISSFASFTTESVTDSAYGKWVKYGVLVKNPTDKATQYKIKFTFGDDETELIQDATYLQKGYAIFAGLNVETISEDNYNLMNADTYLVKNEVLGVYTKYSEEVENETDDNYNITTDYYGKYEIENAPTSYIPDYKFKGTKGEKVSVGVINSKYKDNYSFLGTEEKAVLDTLKQDSNDYAQVVVIKDERDTKDAKLYSNSYVIKTDSFAKISYKLRVTGDSEVLVKLVDNDTTMPPIKLVAGETTKELSAIVTKDTKIINGWSEVCFYVATGNEEINFRLEVSLVKGNGAVFLNKLSNDTSLITTMDAFDSEINLLKEEFAKINMPFADSVKHQRATAKVLSTEDGKDVESSLSFEPIEVYNSNGLYTLVKFTTVHADDVIDNRETDDTTTPDTEEEQEPEEYTVGTDVALQISSIILALALIAVMVVILVRNVRSKNKKKKVKVASYYDRNTRDEAMKKISKKKKDIVIDDTKGEEYDYEEAQQVDENATEAEESETVTEEVVEGETEGEETTEVVEEVVEETPNAEPTSEETTENKE